MSSVQVLRDFISERLTAAAVEIFSEFEKTIIQYEEVIDRQRRLLDITWKPEINLHRISLPANVFKTEIHTDQHQEILNGLQQEESELPHIEDSLQEPLTSLDDGQLPLKQETGAFVAIPEESNICQTVSSSGQLLSHSFPATENEDQDSGSSESTRLFPTKRNQTRESLCNNEGNCPTSEDVCDNGEEERSESLDASEKAFNSKHQMMMHHKVHTDKKPCICNICGKELKYPSHVKSHMRSHTGEKPYSCKLCGRSFSFSCNLRSHERSHTGEKPHFCELCGTSFSRKWNLKYHMKIHTGEIPKSEKSHSHDAYGKKYSCRAALADHERSHAGEKPFNCNTCGRNFSHNADSKVQTRIHSGEAP